MFHTHIKSGNIIVLYILIFIFLGCQRELSFRCKIPASRHDRICCVLNDYLNIISFNFCTSSSGDVCFKTMEGSTCVWCWSLCIVVVGLFLLTTFEFLFCCLDFLIVLLVVYFLHFFWWCIPCIVGRFCSVFWRTVLIFGVGGVLLSSSCVLLSSSCVCVLLSSSCLFTGCVWVWQYGISLLNVMYWVIVLLSLGGDWFYWWRETFLFYSDVFFVCNVHSIHRARARACVCGVLVHYIDRVCAVCNILIVFVWVCVVCIISCMWCALYLLCVYVWCAIYLLCVCGMWCAIYLSCVYGVCSILYFALNEASPEVALYRSKHVVASIRYLR
jgi:hypothetical protein